MNQFVLFSMTLYVVLTIHTVQNQGMVVRNIPQSGRASRAPDDFENFFLKASKSVPRIGRRDFDMNAKYYAGSAGFYKPNAPYPNIVKKYDADYKDLPWSDLAEKIEYYPELLMSPSLLANAGLKDFDNLDFSAREKRVGSSKMLPQNKEILEYRLQPES